MNPNVFLIVFLLINIVAFLVMLFDKNLSRSKKGISRISEGMMFFMATCLGSVGVYLGMFVFRHKTRKWYFLIGIPLLFLQNLTFLYFIYLFFNQGF